MMFEINDVVIHLRRDDPLQFYKIVKPYYRRGVDDGFLHWSKGLTNDNDGFSLFENWICKITSIEDLISLYLLEKEKNSFENKFIPDEKRLKTYIKLWGETVIGKIQN